MGDVVPGGRHIVPGRKKVGPERRRLLPPARLGAHRVERRGRAHRARRLPGRRAGHVPDAARGLQQLDPGRAAPQPGHIQPAAHVRGRAQHQPEPAEQQVHRLLSTVAAEPLYNFYEGPPHAPDQPGAGAGAALQ